MGRGRGTTGSPGLYRDGAGPVKVSVLEGDVLAGQDERHRQRDYSRVQMLLAAVLDEAIGSAVGPIPLSDAGTGNSEKTRRVRQLAIRDNARRWLASNRDDAPYYFTFLHVCQVLRLDPGYVRQQVARRTRDHRPKRVRTVRAPLGFGAGPLVPVRLVG